MKAQGKLNLKGVLIGDGLTDPRGQVQGLVFEFEVWGLVLVLGLGLVLV